MECCFQDFLNTARSILVQLPSGFFSIRLVIAQVVHPYSSMDMTAIWKKNDFQMTDSLSIAVHAFTSHVLMSNQDLQLLFIRHWAVFIYKIYQWNYYLLFIFMLPSIPTFYDLLTSTFKNRFFAQKIYIINTI